MTLTTISIGEYCGSLTSEQFVSFAASSTCCCHFHLLIPRGKCDRFAAAIRSICKKQNKRAIVVECFLNCGYIRKARRQFSVFLYYNSICFYLLYLLEITQVTLSLCESQI
ncbi:hypothetical protein CEXT_148461 [Caerostris extrusa]|uniref:Uncharacterized protein n=1 Tax=Caerostris extrusa TaxID=172846 RepID=A0AAV4X6U7_CAEEX|nr:hypothetical protein CEXT_148461 [Caerostris extrusa]